MFSLLSLLSIAVTVMALPTKIIPADPETWTIPRLDLHFMTGNDGLPGGGWPASMPQFNSTNNFDVQVPFVAHDDSGDFTANCQASFLNGTLPAGTIPCTGTPWDEPFSFSMTPYTGAGAGGRTELAFMLSIFSNRKKLLGTTPITDDFSFSPNAPLFCSAGAPLDGMRCHLNNAIVINATSTEV